MSQDIRGYASGLVPCIILMYASEDYLRIVKDSSTEVGSLRDGGDNANLD
jgi:hypothetical protein